ncbi:hypothetical protein [Acinetobacter sp. CFCC 10889]|uniref:hypothetical protein n=1 Tax=Acinetobacter sp. CFCC 10889 TaxID=1775557 RepID=UPI000DD0DB5D|nr:hypothetical protein [Acinetobacter sp. CFCC 10889]
MSIDDDLVGSEFELTEEEKAQLALEESEEGQEDDQIEEVDQATLDALLNGTGDDGANNDPENNQDTPTDQNQENNAVVDTANQAQEQEQTIVREQVEKYETSLNDLQTQIDESTQKQTDVLTQIDELGKLFDEGEIGQGEYNSRLKRLEIELDTAKKQESDAHSQYHSTDKEYRDFSEEQQSKYIELWKKEVNVFLAENPAYVGEGNYRTRFDEVFQDMQEKGIFAGLDYKQIISTVQHRVEIELGQPEKPKKAAPKALPKHDNVTIPPSMNQLQQLEDNAGGDEFAMIDRLQGLEYEQAIEKLQKNNPEAYKRYMS